VKIVPHNNALLVPSKPELLGFYRKVDEIRATRSVEKLTCKTGNGGTKLSETRVQALY
jgi:hypothetical protein